MFKKDEKAVSPVIGVILMVAITVILAAVIASFVFGMGSSVKKTYTVSATASQESDSIVVTYQGGPDHNALEYINITLPDENAVITSGTDTCTANVTVTGASGEKCYDNDTIKVPSPNVGATIAVDYAGTNGRDHVVVTARFADGSEQVILDTYV